MIDANGQFRRTRYGMICVDGQWSVLDMLRVEQWPPEQSYMQARRASNDFETYWQLACERWRRQEQMS